MPRDRMTHDDLLPWVWAAFIGPHADLVPTARFRAVERAATRRALRLITAVVFFAFAVSGVLAAIAAPERWALIGLVWGSCLAVSAVTFRLSTGLLRRRSIPLAVAFSCFIAIAAIAGSTVSVTQTYTNAFLMAEMSALVGLGFPWTTRSQVTLALVGFAATLAVVTLNHDVPVPLATAAITVAFLSGIFSIAGHLIVRRARLESHARYLHIRDLTLTSAAQQRELARSNRKLARANEGLARVARRDSLTGLGNRLDLNEELTRARADLRAGEPIGLIVLDIDRFKLFNDTNGHLAGDGVLRSIGGAIVDSIRYHDAAFRFGGEEFVVLTRGLASSEVEQIGLRILARIADLGIPHPSSFPWGVITASAGVAMADVSADDPMADALQRADDALFEAKRAGRNRLISTCEPDADAPARGPRLVDAAS